MEILTSNTTKPDGPVIKPNATDNWVLFLDVWTHYKKMYWLNHPVEIHNQLRMTYLPEVNGFLFNLILNSATKERLLSHIKFVVVKGLHKEVCRQIFHSTH